MSESLDTLVSKQKISKEEKLVYELFSLSEPGRDWLKLMFMLVMMEEYPHVSEEFAWHDGRRSIIRDIQYTIDKVEHLLEIQRRIENG